MAWSKAARKGAILTGIATLGLTALSIIWLWFNTIDDPGVTMSSFLGIAFVVSAVWLAIGATMTIFIVMVLRKNEGKDVSD